MTFSLTKKQVENLIDVTPEGYTPEITVSFVPLTTPPQKPQPEPWGSVTDETTLHKQGKITR